MEEFCVALTPLALSQNDNRTEILSTSVVYLGEDFRKLFPKIHSTLHFFEAQAEILAIAVPRECLIFKSFESCIAVDIAINDQLFCDVFYFKLTLLVLWAIAVNLNKALESSRSAMSQASLV